MSTLRDYGKQQLTTVEIGEEKLVWILWVQQEMLMDLEQSVNSNVRLIVGQTRKPRQKITGKY